MFTGKLTEAPFHLVFSMCEGTQQGVDCPVGSPCGERVGGSTQVPCKAEKEEKGAICDVM